MSLQELINKIVVAETENFYKKWVIRKSRSDNYYDVEKYFKRNGVGNFRFESCWAYIQFKKWIESDTYIADIVKIKTYFKQDIIDGFNIQIEQIIFMEDEEDIKDKYKILLDKFNLLKTNDEKFKYISQLYKENDYYPNTFNEIWLFDVFDDRIISDI